MANEERLRHLALWDIEKMIPHRRPFLFLDEAEIVEEGRKAIGSLADLSWDEFAYLRGHFPGNYIVPGAILMEALTELSGIALVSNASEDEDIIGVLRKDTMEYKLPVRHGDKVLLEAEILSSKMGFHKSQVRAYLGESVAVEGEITFKLVDSSA